MNAADWVSYRLQSTEQCIRCTERSLQQCEWRSRRLLRGKGFGSGLERRDAGSKAEENKKKSPNKEFVLNTKKYCSTMLIESSRGWNSQENRETELSFS